MKSTLRSHFPTFIFVLATLVSESPVSAATRTWTGNGGNAMWDDGRNWSGGRAPNSAFGDTAVITGTAKVTVTLNGSRSVSELIVDNPNAILLINSINSQQAKLTVSGNAHNAGVIELRRSSTSAAGSALVVEAGRLFNSGIISALVGGPRELVAKLDNHGVVDVQHDLSVTGEIVNEGTISLFPGKTLFGNPGFVWKHRGGFIFGPGTISLANASTFVLEHDFSPGAYVLNAPNLTVNGSGKFLGPADGEFEIRDWLVNAEVIATGGLKVNGNATFNNGLTVEAGKTLRVVADNSGPSKLRVNNGLTNRGSIELTNESVTGYGARLEVASGDLINVPAGVIRGLLGVGSGTREVIANLQNRGRVEVEHDMSIDGNIANQGTIHLAENKTLRVNSPIIWTHRGGAITGLGTLSLASGSTFVLEEDFAPEKTFVMDAPNLTVNGPGKFFVPEEGEFVIGNWLINTPVYTQIFANSGLKVQGNATFNERLSVAQGSTLRVAANDSGPTTVKVNHGLDNGGIIDLTNESVTGYGATLEVTSGSLMNAQSGVIRILQGVGGGTRILLADLDNRGRVEVQHDLSFTGDIAHQGTIQLADGKTLAVSPALTWNHQGGAITGPGTLSLISGSTLVLENDFTPGTYIFDAPQLTVNGPGKFYGPTEGEFIILNWLINAEVVVTGGLKVLGAVTFNNMLTVPIGKTLRVAANNTVGPATLTVVNGLVNSGIIELSTEGAVGYGTTLVVANGDFFNAPGGVVRVLQGPVGAPRTLDANLENMGELNVATGATLTMKGTLRNRSSGVLTGRGVLDVTTAMASNEGAISPGVSPGILTITGDLPWTASAIFDVEIGGLAGGSQYDRLVLTSPASLNGTIRPRLINGFSPKAGDSFNILTYPSRSGALSVTDSSLPSALAWEVRYGESSTQLVAVTVNIEFSFTSIRRVGNATTFEWNSQPGARYQVQYKTHLDDARWNDLPGEVTTIGNTASFEDSSPDTTRFYQILFAQP